jgi:hypothetical protein
MKTPKIYLVGGGVRDLILGNMPKDFDYVIVGAEAQQLIDRGYKQVGESFPVFLHPESGDEYAMARREKKTAPGYKGFEFEFGVDVTLEEDLGRRDLTINSIAMDLETKEYIDPYNGQEDLRNKIIRHTSDAFSEDPLRVMRVARFAARYGFNVHPDTIELCRKLVDSNELDALSADRIWGELEKLFSEKNSSVGLKFLYDIGALKNVVRLHGLVHEISKFSYDEEAEATLSPIEKMYTQMPIGDMTRDDVERFRIPSEVVRNWKFIDAVFTCVNLNALVEEAGEDYLIQHIINTFNSFREEIKGGKFGDVSKFLNKITKVDTRRTKMFLDSLNYAFYALLDLDFTELVKGMKTGEIKEFVNKTKIDLTKKSLGVAFNGAASINRTSK